ncbi:MAG: hypothetical protein AMS14_00370 [Planctomycetes bacterium DG_20]|nr:MAG: hypothetical protein AMS14_00370 [Planctomycetes bacterium DG_20]
MVRPRALPVLVLAALALASATNAQSTRVEVVVEHDLYTSGAISAGLAQYLADITAQGWSPVVTPWVLDTGDPNAPAALRTHLAERYTSDGLAGAVLIGHLPVATVYTDAGGSIDGEFHPCDLYYTDLDGSWTSSGAHGYLPDTHTDGTGDVGPEIWLGRLTAWNLTALHPGRTEAGLLNDYFAKNHAYRTLALAVPPTGLAYTDDDWYPGNRPTALALAVEGAVTNVWNDPATPGDETTAANYKWRLANESYEHVLLTCHSSSTAHAMSGSVASSDLEALDPQVLFYNLYACSAATYTDFGYIGGEYLFGAGAGLVAVGSAKTGSMQSHILADYFGPLGLGETFGEAMLGWWNTAVDPGGHTDIERAWSYGMTVLGDPLLVTQAYIPEPASAALLAAGALWLLWRRR